MDDNATDAPPNEEIDAAYLDAPRDLQLQELYQYWDTLRRGRAMPLRSEIDATKIPKLLAHIILYNVEAPGGPYTIRLVGEEVRRFVGENTTGRPAGSIMGRRAAATMIGILDAVVSERAPKFRAGKAHWHQEKSYRDFEACLLPLAADDDTVNVILMGVKFPL